jgi:predicted adenylyl cyclase CyaB
MRNIEIKARINNLAELARKVAAIATSGPTEILQDDTFFKCDGGRLKLRAFPDGQGELIFYRRADQQGPKESFYLICPTPSSCLLREILSLAFGQSGRVEKRRTLFLVGRTRVHLDQVKHLGEFVELEVVLGGEESADAGIAEAHALMERLGVGPSQLIDGAYVDLLKKASKR